MLSGYLLKKTLEFVNFLCDAIYDFFSDIFNKGKHNMKQLNRTEIFSIVMPIIMGALYLIGAFDLDYGYYVFVRIATLVFLGIFACVCANHYDSFLNYPTLSSVALIILFNPFSPLGFEKNTWVVLDILSAIIAFVSSGILIYRFTNNQNET